MINIKLSNKSIYAIKSLIYMAKIKNYISLKNIALHLNVSKIYLEHVFSLLKNNNLVSSKKGSLGGYCLAKDINEINLLDILKITESNNITNYPNDLFLNNLINIIKKNYENSLEKLTLHNLLELELTTYNIFNYHI